MLIIALYATAGPMVVTNKTLITDARAHNKRGLCEYTRLRTCGCTCCSPHLRHPADNWLALGFIIFTTILRRARWCVLASCRQYLLLAACDWWLSRIMILWWRRWCWCGVKCVYLSICLGVTHTRARRFRLFFDCIACANSRAREKRGIISRSKRALRHCAD